MRPRDPCWPALLLIAFLAAAGTSDVVGKSAASEATSLTQTTAEPASHNARRARSRVTRGRRTTRPAIPLGNPTRPGLDRCGISAVAVCPLR